MIAPAVEHERRARAVQQAAAVSVPRRAGSLV